MLPSKESSHGGLSNNHLLPVLRKLLHSLPPSPRSLKSNRTLLQHEIVFPLFLGLQIAAVELLNRHGGGLHVSEPLDAEPGPDVGLDHDDDVEHRPVALAAPLHAPPRLQAHGRSPRPQEVRPCHPASVHTLGGDGGPLQLLVSPPLQVSSDVALYEDSSPLLGLELLIFPVATPRGLDQYGRSLHFQKPRSLQLHQSLSHELELDAGGCGFESEVLPPLQHGAHARLHLDDAVPCVEIFLSSRHLPPPGRQLCHRTLVGQESLPLFPHLLLCPESYLKDGRCCFHSQVILSLLNHFYLGLHYNDLFPLLHILSSHQYHSPPRGDSGCGRLLMQELSPHILHDF